jgi:hypothetical protein
MLEKLLEKAGVIDVLIIVITSLAIVSFWRGVWGLMDIYLFPENRVLSLVISLIIGLVILFAIALYKVRKVKNKRK